MGHPWRVLSHLLTQGTHDRSKTATAPRHEAWGGLQATAAANQKGGSWPKDRNLKNTWKCNLTAEATYKTRSYIC